jgi:localization factor PodJL
MTLGEWLNRMIIEGEGVDAAALEAFGEPSRPSLAVNNERPGASYYETARGGAPARIEAREHPADEVGRVAIALDRLTDRIESAEKRSAQAISGIDESVRSALQRLATAEREQVAVAARFEGAVDEIKTEQTRATERLRRIENEAAGPRSAEALRALEGALGKVAGHLYEGEARTRETIAHLEQRLDNQASAGQVGVGAGDPSALVDEVVARLGQRLEAAEARTAEALQALGASFTALDGRLRTVETSNPGEGVQKRLDELSNGLTQRMEAARMEMAAKLRQSADGRFDRMEAKLGEMTAHVQAAEQRSAQAIERMGREVVGMADALNRRVQTSEARNTAAIEQVAASIDQKLNRADNVQAQALEKLGTEIARITEKLAERISNAERRNALAIDDVGDQVTRVTDRLNQRHERSSQELVDRIRQSEERTARMLEEAREKIDARLGEAQRKLAEQAAAAPAARPAPSPFDGERYSFGGEPVPEDVFDQPTAFIPAQASTPARTAAPAVYEAPVYEAPSFPASEPAEPEFGDEDFEAADGFVSAPEPETAFEADADYDTDFAAPDFAAPQFSGAQSSAPEFSATEEPAAPSRPLSTREVIEQARAAARQAALAGETKGKDKPKAKKAGTSLFSGFGAKSSEKKAKKGALKTALMVSATAAFMGVGAAGYFMSTVPGTGRVPDRVAQGTSLKPTSEIRSAEADTSPASARAAVALTSQVPVDATALPAEAAPAVTPPAENAQALYEDGVRRIEAKDRTGLEPLRKAANLGLPRAQFYLAKMYEVGEGGVKKDLVEARRWTERAATAGEARAMHNLALYYYKGDGGERNSTKAASWFRKAADLGLVDSQFNLAQLYEFGRGADQNPTEAYKWYLIAAKNGDTSARARAMALRSQLTPEGQRTAERSAYGFRSQAAAAPVQTASVSAASAGLATAQKALSRLGYYQGPQDGVASPALRMAISAYQRDQNLTNSGALDGETLSRLATWVR